MNLRAVSISFLGMRYRVWGYGTYYPGQYYRVGFRRPTNVVLTLIAANVAVFFVEMLAPTTFVLTFGLVPPLIVKRLYLWQFVTYMFLHGNFAHLFFNMLALYIFGHDLEMLWGARRFLFYYFVTGIGAGLCAFAFTRVPTIGASGAVYGLLLAYGITFPNRILLLYLFIPMRAKYLVILFGVVEFLASVSGRPDGIAHSAHLGGMFFGALVLWVWSRMDRGRTRGGHTEVIVIPARPYLDDIDDIYDKILSEGFESLTSVERRRLIESGKYFSGCEGERRVR